VNVYQEIISTSGETSLVAIPSADILAAEPVTIQANQQQTSVCLQYSNLKTVLDIPEEYTDLC